MATKSRNWIVYKAESTVAQGWEERLLMPRRSLTDILWEHQTSSHKLPQIGDRVQQFANLSEPGNGATHSKPDDWVVSEVHEFSSPTTPTKIVVCYCQYQPINAEWREMKRGRPVDEMLPAVETK